MKKTFISLFCLIGFISLCQTNSNEIAEFDKENMADILNHCEIENNITILKRNEISYGKISVDTINDEIYYIEVFKKEDKRYSKAILFYDTDDTKYLFVGSSYEVSNIVKFDPVYVYGFNKDSLIIYVYCPQTIRPELSEILTLKKLKETINIVKKDCTIERYKLTQEKGHLYFYRIDESGKYQLSLKYFRIKGFKWGRRKLSNIPKM
jgi:hypothetical protein